MGDVADTNVVTTINATIVDATFTAMETTIDATPATAIYEELTTDATKMRNVRILQSLAFSPEKSR